MSGIDKLPRWGIQYDEASDTSRRFFQKFDEEVDINDDPADYEEGIPHVPPRPEPITRGPLLALVGYKGTGKTTLMESIEPNRDQRRAVENPNVPHHGYAQLLPIAGSLKDAYKAFVGMHGLDMADPIVKASNVPGTDIPIRKWLEETGQLWRRMDPLMHVKMWERKYEAMQQWPIVVDDLNFPNEVEAVRRLGGIVVYVSRMAVLKRKPWEQHNGGPALDSDKGVRAIVEGGLYDRVLRLDATEDVRSFISQVKLWFMGGLRPVTKEEA